MNLKEQILAFLEHCEIKGIELYNEPSLQYELAIFLRNKLINSNVKVELERNVSHFGLNKYDFRKREIDIVVYNNDFYKGVIELKYSTIEQGKVPERMFEICEDIFFLEQLKKAGFDECISLFISNNKNFWYGKSLTYPYHHFRLPNVLITGEILKPTGKDLGKRSLKKFKLDKEYKVSWQDFDQDKKYIITNVV